MKTKIGTAFDKTVTLSQKNVVDCQSNVETVVPYFQLDRAENWIGASVRAWTANFQRL